MDEMARPADEMELAICLVNAMGERSLAIHGETELGQALVDAAWVGNPARAIGCGGLSWEIAGMGSLWGAKLDRAMKDYVWRGEHGRANIARCAHALARDVWPQALALLEARSLEAEARPSTPGARSSRM